MERFNVKWIHPFSTWDSYSLRYTLSLVTNCVLSRPQVHFEAHICMKLTWFSEGNLFHSFSFCFVKTYQRFQSSSIFLKNASHCCHASILSPLQQFMFVFHFFSQQIKLFSRQKTKFTFFLDNEHKISVPNTLWGKWVRLVVQLRNRGQTFLSTLLRAFAAWHFLMLSNMQGK